MALQRIPFGKTGLSISRLGFGSAEVGFLGTEKAAAGRMMNWMLDQGINLMDTAANYAGAEELIGEQIGHRRKDYVLVSKCGHKVSGTEGEPWSASLIAQTVERTLRNCRTDVLDVMLLHSCDLDTLRKGEALGALLKARDTGKVRFVGYSGDNEAAAYAATLPDVAVIETSVNVADQVNIDRVLPSCVKGTIGVLAKRPIANAAWKDIEQQPGFYKSYAKAYTDRLREMKITPQSVGFDGSWAEMALRFTLSQPGVTCAIVGTTRQENVQANISAIAKGPLPGDVIQKIRAAFKAADPKGTWTGQT
jgi:aryl-alcohol dehydrogenase-like predicted oxidoreductase